MRESQFQNTYMNMEYGIFGILSFGNQESVPSWGNLESMGKRFLETGIMVNSGWHMLNDTSLLVFSVVPSSVIQQVCIHYITAFVIIIMGLSAHSFPNWHNLAKQLPI